MSQANPRNLPALTGLRGVAALWVILYHLFQFSGDIPIVESGYAGVDVFFLLSGFVLSHVYLQKAPFTVRGYLQFLGVRLARIYPLHVFTLFCLLLIVLALPGFATSYQHPPGAFSTVAFAANLLLVQNWGFFGFQSWNSPAWSLSAEWFAYLVFPLLLVPIARIERTSLLIGLAAVVLSGTIGALYLTGWHNLEGPDRAGMIRMAGEFTAGCLMYAAFAKGWRIPPIAGLVLIFAIVGIGRLLPWGGLLWVFAFALLVQLAAQGQNGYARALQWLPVLYLGEISFSIYLTHLIVIHVFNWMVENGLRWERPWINASILFAVLVLSSATYRFIEIPARKFGRRLSLIDRKTSDVPAALA